jgi:hypothetical protein
MVSKLLLQSIIVLIIIFLAQYYFYKGNLKILDLDFNEARAYYFSSGFFYGIIVQMVVIWIVL